MAVSKTKAMDIADGQVDAILDDPDYTDWDYEANEAEVRDDN